MIHFAIFMLIHFAIFGDAFAIFTTHLMLYKSKATTIIRIVPAATAMYIQIFDIPSSKKIYNMSQEVNESNEN